jgi:hypothetical protein
LFQRRLSTGGKQSRVLGDNRGLSASRKRSRSQNDGEQLNDVPNTSSPDQLGVGMNPVYFNVNVRSSGITDGRHVVTSDLPKSDGK